MEPWAQTRRPKKLPEIYHELPGRALIRNHDPLCPVIHCDFIFGATAIC